MDSDSEDEEDRVFSDAEAIDDFIDEDEDEEEEEEVHEAAAEMVEEAQDAASLQVRAAPVLARGAIALAWALGTWHWAL